MPFTPEQEAGLLAMLSEWQDGKDAQAQSLIDQKQTAEGQLRGLQPLLRKETAEAVEAELRAAPVAETLSLKG